MSRKVSIVVLNYNGLSFLKDCITSINEQSYKNIEVIVIDNNSKDGSVEWIKNQKNIIFILNNSNLGYCKANNLGVNNAAGDFVFIINNDTKIQKDTVERLVKAYKEKSILIPKQIIIREGVFIGSFCGNGADIFGYPYKSNKIFYADGAALFLRRNDFIELGGFDEELFMFQEDIDFSWRARLYGYSLISVPKAKVEHYSGGVNVGGAVDPNKPYETTLLRRYLNEKNVIRNLLKNYTVISLIVLLPILLFLHLLEILGLIVFGKFSLVRQYFKAYYWNIKNIHGTIKYRKMVQSNRKVSDFAIMKKMVFGYQKIKAFREIKKLRLVK